MNVRTEERVCVFVRVEVAIPFSYSVMRHMIIFIFSEWERTGYNRQLKIKESEKVG